MNKRKTAPLTGSSESEEKNMIRECKEPIAEDNAHGISHRNRKGMEQLREEIEKERRLLNEQLAGGHSPLDCMEQSRKVDRLLEQYIDMKRGLE